MKPTEDGRFCGSCQKTVVDFTVMSDAEVTRFVTRQKGSACGRFRAEQLNRPLRPYLPAPYTQRRLPGLLTVGLLSWHITQAQVNAQQTGDAESSVRTITSQTPSNPVAPVVSGDSSRIIVGRIVAGPDGKPVSGVTIRIVDTYNYVYTYDANTFRITVPVEQAAANVVLSISHGEYVSLEIVVKPDQQGPILVTLTEEVVFMGEVAAVKLPEKPSFLDRLRNRLPTKH